MFVCETGGMVVICAGTTGYNATVDLRYLWMRQKRVQGSHFANDDQSYAMNDLALKGLLNPCMSKAFPYDGLPTAHQLMHDNLHPHGNMAVLIGAPDFGLGKTAKEPSREYTRVTMPAGDIHDTSQRHPYPLSAPLPDVASEIEEIQIVDDGTKVHEHMHPGIISCARQDNLHDAAKHMIDNDVHALVVIEGNRAVGVLSQTDIVLARQGSRIEEVRQFTVSDWMTEGCATIDADAAMSAAISQMLKMRIHRLVVTENGKPVGVLSMTDIARKAIATD
jgi:crotonyl-CoA carboxylase/reductase